MSFGNNPALICSNLTTRLGHTIMKQWNALKYLRDIKPPVDLYIRFFELARGIALLLTAPQVACNTRDSSVTEVSQKCKMQE